MTTYKGTIELQRQPSPVQHSAYLDLPEADRNALQAEWAAQLASQLPDLESALDGLAGIELEVPDGLDEQQAVSHALARLDTHVEPLFDGLDGDDVETVWLGDGSTGWIWCGRECHIGSLVVAVNRAAEGTYKLLELLSEAKDEDGRPWSALILLRYKVKGPNAEA